MQMSDVVRFIGSIRDPEKFLEYCRKFHEYEPRGISYVVSRSMVSKDPNNISFKLAGLRLS